MKVYPMLISYVRDAKRRPVACIVSNGKDIGVSLACEGKGKKQQMIWIAANRMRLQRRPNANSPTAGRLDVCFRDVYPIELGISKMAMRAGKYYGDNYHPGMYLDSWESVLPGRTVNDAVRAGYK